MPKKTNSNSVKLKALHITNWYPTYNNPNTASWINGQIKALDLFCKNELIHAEVIQGRFKFSATREVFGNRNYRLSFPTSKWFIKEILSSCLLFWILIFKVNQREYNIINIHIAYPLCTYLNLIRPFLKAPLVISEHWSAYHFNFGIKNDKKLKRIKRIFKYNIPIIAVSNALIEDICKFAGEVAFQNYIVPNIVDTNNFKFQDRKQSESLNFFMISQWKEPKDPCTAIQAFAELIRDFPEYRLRIGGYGDQVTQMLSLIEELGLTKQVSFLGILAPEQVAKEMQQAVAFVHISHYETFSVVCAEAACCGTPVIATGVGGIAEYLNPENSILLEHSSKDTVSKAMVNMAKNHNSYNRQKISEKATRAFNPQFVGRQYFNVLQEICNLNGTSE